MEKQTQIVKAAPIKLKERDLSNTMPGYKINEYLLVLNPHEALRDKIMEIKKYFSILIKILRRFMGNRISHW